MDHQKPETVLRGGRVINPESGFDQTADVLIENGLVTAIETTPGIPLHLVPGCHACFLTRSCLAWSRWL